MIALVFLATVINYLDRQTLSVAAPVLREQFHMSNQEYSRVVFAFLLAYTISNGFSGGLIDHLGTRAGYAICVAVWSLAAMMHALATGPLFLAASRFLLGLGEAGNWPAGVKVVAEWFPERERALASGIFNGGSSSRRYPGSAGRGLDYPAFRLARRFSAGEVDRDRLAAGSERKSGAGGSELLGGK